MFTDMCVKDTIDISFQKPTPLQEAVDYLLQAYNTQNKELWAEYSDNIGSLAKTYFLQNKISKAQYTSICEFFLTGG